MNDENTPISILKDKVKTFISRRKWEKYHTPKNIAESIVIEAAELLECFQWRSEEESTEYINKEKVKVEEELADIIIYCISLANFMSIDITSTVLNKLKINEEKYPVNKYLGDYFR